MTEAEWEYSAGGGMDVLYAVATNIHDAAWFEENSGGATRCVGMKEANAYGLYDMSGNVSEWCYDIYCEGFYTRSGFEVMNPHCCQDDFYKGKTEEEKDPMSGRHPKEYERIVRGGSCCADKTIASHRLDGYL